MSSFSPPVSDRVPDADGGGYAQLFREVRTAGLMERRHGWYAALIGVTAGAFAGAVVAFVLLGDSWWQLGIAAVFAVLFAQMGFIGHDAGHGQIFTGRRSNDAVGYVHGDLLIGLGYGWWVGKHNEHHANPNHEDRDPDVDLGVLALTSAQADTDGAIARGPVGRFVIRHQAGLFFPMRNITGSRVKDFVLGGLNYQIEHHLFPRMPRPHLRHAQPLVRAHCERHGIPYTETGLFESYARGLRHLRAVSAPARRA